MLRSQDKRLRVSEELQRVLYTPLVPVYVAAGAQGAGTGAVTPPLPAGMVTNDLMFLFGEMADSVTAMTITNANGGIWTAIPQFDRRVFTSSRIFGFYSVFNGTQGDPTLAVPSDHVSSGILGFRYAADWVHLGGFVGPTSTTAEMCAAVTPIDNVLVVMFACTAFDAAAASPQVTTFTNSALANVADLVAYNTNAGSGGGFGVGVGLKVRAGKFSGGTATLANGSVNVTSTILLFGAAQ